MITSFAHKGLEKFFLTGSKAGIQPHHAGRLQRQLRVLDMAKEANDMNQPGYNLHPLTGEFAGHFSVTVNGNWRLTFTFKDGNAVLVNYQDYH